MARVTVTLARAYAMRCTGIILIQGAEIFGPASLVARCVDRGELLEVLEHLDGQLTMTLQMDESDHPMAQALLPTLERKAGRH
jgi:NADP-dependent aldehyde dehydrogenase